MIEFTYPPTGEPPRSEKLAINPDRVTIISPSGSGAFITFDVDSGVLVAEDYHTVLNKFRLAVAGKAH